MPRADADSLAVVRNFSIDRSSPVPLYYQASQQLEQAVVDGRLPPGTLLLNEIDLADALSLSRPTMRRAIQSLVDKGLVVRRRGIGTRVVQPKMRRPLGLSSLYDDLANSGQHPSTQVLSLQSLPASTEVADRLRLDNGSEVLELIRLRCAADLPIARMINYLPRDMVSLDEGALSERGLYDLIRAQGITLHSATQSIGARSASAAEAKLLLEPKGAALLTAERITYDDQGRVVEFGTHIYAASRYSFEIGMLSP